MVCGAAASRAVWLGPDGALFVTGPTLSSYDVLYRIAADGTVTTRHAAFGRPQGLAFDPSGTLFVVDALAGAVAMQQAIAGRAPDTEPLAMRIGLASGEAAFDDNDYFGIPVVEAARLCALANGGENPITGQRAIDAQYVKDLLSVMHTCGMYDYAGEWAYRVGIPPKSGVGGGIIAVSPGKFGIAVVSPPLDDAGNSIRAQRAITDISNALGGNPYAKK